MVPGCKAGKDGFPIEREKAIPHASMVPGCKAGKDGPRPFPSRRPRSAGFNGARL